MQSLIISTLAEYQTAFWVSVARKLVDQGHQLTFVSYDTRSTQMLEARGFAVCDATLTSRKAALGSKDPIEVCKLYGIENPGPLLTHERLAFDIRDSNRLLCKLAGALIIGHSAIAQAQAQTPPWVAPVIVQELGGFLSVLGLHHAALHAGVDSLFIEPSFFKGRIQFVSNTLAALHIESNAQGPVTAELSKYLADALERGTVVVPEKDRHHYSSAATKILNRRNIRRLVEKSRDKYLLGAEQEFEAIGHHVKVHLKMLEASYRLRNAYTDIDDLGPFIYYPLHVPGDVALTLRSPEFCDQLALLDYLCRTAPVDITIATKEHPAMIGAVSSEGLMALKRRYDRFAIIPPTTNNYSVLRKARSIVTVNSKSGAEAGLLGKEVIVLGDAFYRNAPFSVSLSGMEQIGPAIAVQGKGLRKTPSVEQTHAFFGALWKQTYPGELYSTEPKATETFANSLLIALQETHAKASNATSWLSA